MRRPINCLLLILIPLTLGENPNQRSLEMPLTAVKILVHSLKAKLIKYRGAKELWFKGTQNTMNIQTGILREIR